MSTATYLQTGETPNAEDRDSQPEGALRSRGCVGAKNQQPANHWAVWEHVGYDVINSTHELMVGGASCPEVLLGAVGGACGLASQSQACLRAPGQEVWQSGAAGWEEVGWADHVTRRGAGLPGTAGGGGTSPGSQHMAAVVLHWGGGVLWCCGHHTGGGGSAAGVWQDIRAEEGVAGAAVLGTGSPSPWDCWALLTLLLWWLLHGLVPPWSAYPTSRGLCSV